MRLAVSPVYAVSPVTPSVPLLRSGSGPIQFSAITKRAFGLGKRDGATVFHLGGLSPAPHQLQGLVTELTSHFAHGQPTLSKQGEAFSAIWQHPNDEGAYLMLYTPKNNPHALFRGIYSPRL